MLKLGYYNYVCECGCGKLVAYGKRFINRHNIGFQGKKHSKKTKLKMSNVKTGISRSLKVKMLISASHTGLKQSPEHIAATKKAMNHPDIIAKIIKVQNSFSVKVAKSNSAIKNWQDPVYIAKQIKARHTFPNKPEKFLTELLEDLFPGEWKYVGSGDLIIGRKNPDFVNENKKKIIEFFGDFWHSKEVIGIPIEQHVKERIDLFTKYGYQTLIIWEYELEDLEKLIEKILLFNGELKWIV